MMNFEAVGGSCEFHEKRSQLDESINFSKSSSDGGMIETRFVRRRHDRFIVYISSMTGCNKACRFCHLTQTGQTMARNLSINDMVEQAAYVLSRSSFSAGETVHFNFMARGEPLSNPNVGKELFEKLGLLARGFGLVPRIKISTIMPTDIYDDVFKNFVPKEVPVDIYYSLYSMDESWRRRWVPKALPAEEGLSRLARFQMQTGQRVVIHGALIEDENDNIDSAERIGQKAREFGLNFDFNLVRYNPANDRSRESNRHAIDQYLFTIGKYVCEPNRVKEIPRVGFDVAASCGMFLSAA